MYECMSFTYGLWMEVNEKVYIASMNAVSCNEIESNSMDAVSRNAIAFMESRGNRITQI